MTLKVIGAGIGRTGTYSLKLALEHLGFGPCHHMEEVVANLPAQLPLWNSALEGQPDWASTYQGYASAVDWPTARFYAELNAAYPEARFVLTHRSPESWVQSFGGTIYTLMGKRDEAPAELQPWLDMGVNLLASNGIPQGLDDAGLAAAFQAHNEAVRKTIPSERLLVFQVKEGWEPLCRFLDVPVPDEPFPRSNNRTEFWDLIPGMD